MDCFLVKNGGGAPLNFKVVGNPQPASPKENTIWVNTDVPIGKWYFDANQPDDLQEGDVWFPVGTSSPVEFNALRKNGIQVYPNSAKQYVGGALVDVTAKSYQNGEWVDWVTYLYNLGDECVDITGGWRASPDYPAGTVNKQDTYIEFYGTIGVAPGTLTHATPITPSGKKLFVVISVTDVSGKDVVIFSSDSGGINKIGEITVTSNCTEKQFEIPLDNAQNVSGYVFLNANGNAKMRLHRAWLK